MELLPLILISATFLIAFVARLMIGDEEHRDARRRNRK